MPKLLKTPFAIDAAEGFRTDIQESAGAAPNSATYQVGFPPVTMQSIASNGMPPKGSDLNGVLYDITDNLVFMTQGGGYGFDAAYATSIGGYPLNARLRLTNGDIVKSTIDGNTNDPNVGMTGWVKTNSASQIVDDSGKTQQAVNNERVSIYRFMLLADFVAEQLNPETFDWLTVFNRAGASKKSVFVPYKSSSYKLSSAFEVKDGTFIEGEGRYTILETTGVNKRIAFANGGESAGFRNIHLKGNMTGLGSTAASVDGGEGIAIFDMRYPVIEWCYFSEIGNTANTFASPIRLQSCKKYKIHKNVFLSGKSTTGADINVGYYCSESDITENISVSEHDAFISAAAVGAIESETVHHNITRNIGIRSATTVARSAITLPYDARPAYGNVSNNILVGFTWNGVYVSAAQSTATNTGGLNIFGNIVMNCGGAAGNISSGIYLSGRNGINCYGNLIEKSGYATDGAKRAANVSGIYIVGTTSDVNVYGNHIKGSTSAGIHIKNTSGNTAMDLISLKSNHLIDNEVDGVFVEIAGATASIDIVSINDNTIKSLNQDANGIRISAASSAPTPKKVDIFNNKIIGKVGSTKAAIWCNMAGFKDWDVSKNKMYNHANGVQLTNGTMADKEIGTEIIFKGNRFKDIGTAWTVGFGSSVFGFVYDSEYVNVTTRASNGGGVLDAVNHGTLTEFVRAAVPTAGAWKIGDRMSFSAPSTYIGAVCTAAGSPGTWKNFGAIV